MSRTAPFWPAALRLDQAAEYCELSVEAFLRSCPLQAIPLNDCYLKVRVDEWLDSLPLDWKPDDEPNDFVVAGKQPGWVYVVGFSNYVKIGYTSKMVEERIVSLQTGCPETLVIYATLPGSKRFEGHLHRRFAVWRTQGEWFRREGDLSAWIEGGCK